MPEEKNITNEISTDHGKILASWEFPEFKKTKKTTGWYIGMAILVGALVAFSIATQNYLFLIIIALFVIIYVLRSRREPTILNIQITEDGIGIGPQTFYEWKDVKSFWIIYEPPEVKNLYLDFKTGLRTSITISLENQNPLQIRKILLEYILEDTEKENETFSDGLHRTLKL